MKNERNNGSGFDNSKKERPLPNSIETVWSIMKYSAWLWHFQMLCWLKMKKEEKKKRKNGKERLSKISNIKTLNISNGID